MSASKTPTSAVTDDDLFNQHIHFIGGGNMANSIIGGLIKRGLPPTCISVTEPNPERAQALQTQWGITLNQGVDSASVILLAIKPQIFSSALPPLASSIKPGTLVISIAAGIRRQDIRQWLGQSVKLIRAMPNTPALIGFGAIGLFGDDSLTDLERQRVDQIMSSVGMTLWVNSEALIDAVTAVSGSGPAYYFLLMEAMIKAGEQLGLTYEQSQALTLQTALGAATLATDTTNSDNPEALRKKVTSPGGTTAAAIDHMIQQQLPEIVEAALKRAYDRANELANT